MHCWFENIGETKAQFSLAPPPFPIPLSQYPSINVGKLGVFEKNIGYEDDWNVS